MGMERWGRRAPIRATIQNRSNRLSPLATLAPETARRDVDLLHSYMGVAA